MDIIYFITIRLGGRIVTRNTLVKQRCEQLMELIKDWEI